MSDSRKRSQRLGPCSPSATESQDKRDAALIARCQFPNDSICQLLKTGDYTKTPCPGAGEGFESNRDAMPIEVIVPGEKVGLRRREKAVSATVTRNAASEISPHG
jgi:hypothetical protein